MQSLAATSKKSSILTRCILVLIACVALYKVTGYLYSFALSTHYSSYIPASLEIDKTVFVGAKTGGFIEGCGVAIFKLSENTSANISGGGIAFLSKNSRTSDSKHKQYASWKETPFAITRGEYSVFDHLVNEDAGGNICVDLSESLKKSISSAVNNPGAFHSRFNEDTELIVIPNLRLAIFSHHR